MKSTEIEKKHPFLDGFIPKECTRLVIGPFPDTGIWQVNYTLVGTESESNICLTAAWKKWRFSSS